MKTLLSGFLLMLTLIPSALGAQTLPGGFEAAYVEGIVTAADTGKPLAGAKIDVIGAKVSRRKGVKASGGCGAGFSLAAANGDFAVGVGLNNMCVTRKHPINGKYFVSVSKRGYLPQMQQIDFAIGHGDVRGPLIFRLDNAHANIRGQVVSGGKGLPYAYVWVMKDMFAGGSIRFPTHVLAMMSDAPMVRTDANGNFTIPVSPGSYIVLASKTGYQLMTKTSSPGLQQLSQKLSALPNMTPQIRAVLEEMNQPQLGVHVSVAVLGNAYVQLAMVKAPTAPESPGSMVKPEFHPFKIYLDGQARSSPNNVLFFSALALGGSQHNRVMLDVVRSRMPLGAGQVDPFKAHIKTFNFALYGWPGRVGCSHRAGHISSDYCLDDVLSFTDPTGTPGTVYYYYIYEAPPYDVSPGVLNVMQRGMLYSNAKQLVTH